MQIVSLQQGNELWYIVADYARNCSWAAGKSLAKEMHKRRFLDWERVFVALDDENIAGYCTFVEKDCLPDVLYTPYIGYLFVGETYRGNRLSEKIIISVLEYAKNIGIPDVYLVSDHVNLYEKYGFIKIDEKPAPWDVDSMESIFIHFT